MSFAPETLCTAEEDPSSGALTRMLGRFTQRHLVERFMPIVVCCEPRRNRSRVDERKTTVIQQSHVYQRALYQS